MSRSLHTFIDFKVIEEVWSDNPINYSSLRIFVCLAYPYVNDGKLAPRAIKCMFFWLCIPVQRILFVAS